MRVVYYTHTAFFEVALSVVRELAVQAEVHLLVEVAPTAWQHSAFDVPRRELPTGLVPADDLLRDGFPAGVREYWSAAASFHLVAHRSRRSFHPASWRVSRRVLEFARSLGADVLHVDDVDVSPRLSLALPQARGLPVVLGVHDPEPHTGEDGWRKRVARALAYRGAARFVLHNRSMKAEFCRRLGIEPGLVSVAPFAPLDIFRQWGGPSAGPPERPTILFFGRISRYKGLDVLYRALPRVAERVPGVRVVVAGRTVAGYEPPQPPALAPPAAVEVRDGYLTNPELADLLGQAMVVACPYRDATQSGVVLTAFAFRRPVVATAVGGIPEYIADGESGLLVPPGDPAALADALARVLGDAALRRRLTLGIEDHARSRLTWRRTAEAVLEAYAAAADGRRVRVATATGFRLSGR